MAAITILPEAAAQAGCSAELIQFASGDYPIPPHAPQIYDESGEWLQFKIKAGFVGLWRSCSVTIGSRVYGVYKQRAHDAAGQVYYSEQPFDFPNTQFLTYLSPDDDEFTPRAMTADDDRFENDVALELLVNGSMRRWSSHDVEDGYFLFDNYCTTEIASVVVKFYGQDIPHGPILCNSSGVLICNHSGSLLWH